MMKYISVEFLDNLAQACWRVNYESYLALLLDQSFKIGIRDYESSLSNDFSSAQTSVKQCYHREADEPASIVILLS